MDFDYVVMPGILVVIAFLVIWWSIRRMRSLGAPNFRRVAESRNEWFYRSLCCWWESQPEAVRSTRLPCRLRD